MIMDGLTPEDIRRINGFKFYVKFMADYNRRIETNDPGPHYDMQYWHWSRLNDAFRTAMYIWFVKEDVVAFRKCLHDGGESSVLMMRDFDKPDPVQMAYVDGKFHKLTQKKDGTWAHHSKEGQKMLESRIPDVNVLEEDLLPDLSKNFVFVQHYARIPENAIPGLECALGSGDIELARQVAQYAGSVGDFDFIKSLAYYSRVLKYAILDDKDRFNKAYDGLETAPKKSPYQELGRSYAAVMTGDGQAAQKAFQSYINWFGKKRKIRKTYHRINQETGAKEPFEKIEDEYYLSFAGLAFCNFAASCGIKIDVDEPFLPKALIIIPQ